MKDNHEIKGPLSKLSPEEVENKEIRTRYTYSNPYVFNPDNLEDEPDAHKVWLKVGVQSFLIGEVEDKEQADWMRDMLAKALGNMVREFRNK